MVNRPTADVNGHVDIAEAYRDLKGTAAIIAALSGSFVSPEEPVGVLIIHLRTALGLENVSPLQDQQEGGGDALDAQYALLTRELRRALSDAGGIALHPQDNDQLVEAFLTVSTAKSNQN